MFMLNKISESESESESNICQKENFKVYWHSIQNSKIFRHEHVNTNVSFICFPISHLLR